MNGASTQHGSASASSGGGFGLRGQRTSVINGKDRGSQNGAMVQRRRRWRRHRLRPAGWSLSYIGSRQPTAISNLSDTQDVTWPKIRRRSRRSSHATAAGASSASTALGGDNREPACSAERASANGGAAIALGGDAEALVRNLKIDPSNATTLGRRLQSLPVGSGSPISKSTAQGATDHHRHPEASVVVSWPEHQWLDGDPRRVEIGRTGDRLLSGAWES